MDVFVSDWHLLLTFCSLSVVVTGQDRTGCEQNTRTCYADLPNYGHTSRRQCFSGFGREGNYAGEQIWCNADIDCGLAKTCLARQKCDTSDWSNHVDNRGRKWDEMQDISDKSWTWMLRDYPIDKAEQRKGVLSNDNSWGCYLCACHIWSLDEAPATEQKTRAEGGTQSPYCIAGDGPFDIIPCKEPGKPGAASCAEAFRRRADEGQSDHIRCLYPPRGVITNDSMAFMEIRRRLRSNDVPPPSVTRSGGMPTSLEPTAYAGASATTNVSQEFTAEATTPTSEGGNSTGLAVGLSCLGGAVLILVGVGLFVFYRKKTSAAEDDLEDSEEPEPGRPTESKVGMHELESTTLICKYTTDRALR